ncbi:MAG: 2-oxoglutarate dehydrogenase E1 component [Phycisphaeraceae bacterium]|nr:2-oxoglutarate dehydrogenase E1 component [Phycisphaerales bacterium]MCB9859184.1 2-oxoglutarate dehydrogenase E1 component [Phycisphaeraceae bacterium]
MTSTRGTTGTSASPAATNGWNAAYLDAQHEQYRTNPDSLPPDVRAFFQGFELASSLGSTSDKTSGVDRGIADLIYAYRQLGHIAATVDPFGRVNERPKAMTLEHHGLAKADLTRHVDPSAASLYAGGPLQEVIDHLDRTYCRNIGFEYMHVQNTEEREWLWRVIEENEGRIPISDDTRKRLLSQVLKSESFETFLGKRYPGDKRFSLEGGESLIVLLEQMIERASDLNVEETVIGMAHRGRLNVLNNVVGKSYEQIFTEFEDTWGEDFVDGGGDVKYHRGYSGQRTLANGKTMHLALSSNPSHLDAVDPVVLGRARAKQYLSGDLQRKHIMPLLIHGDAAIAGQGIIAECLNLSQLEGYTVGGTVHVVINNQIGFTTLPEDARSTRYCTDVAKMIDAPIFHVNGDDPEACVTAAQIAVEYRQKFGKDVFIDLVGFRKYGHNEQDEAAFTQPLMADKIKKKPSVLNVYADKLLATGVINNQVMQAIKDEINEALERAQDAAKNQPYDPTIDPGSRRWSKMKRSWDFEPVNTGVPMKTLTLICNALGTVPEGFNVHRKLVNLLKDRKELPKTKKISYADAESLAYGSLLLEGVPVRLSGQDCRRGTFSHRHGVLRDAKTGEAYIPLDHITEVGMPGTDTPPLSKMDDGRKRQAQFGVWDSPLSEASVLGFEYGASMVDPYQLVLWEAQFGDFVNGAQTIIDQFIVNAEIKWDRWSGLVMLLPHGYEGAGPEHSSGRMERFLQSCAQKNIQVVYPSTGAQMFHLIRRQVQRDFRKPLVVMTPKSMLRTATSTIDELTKGSFLEVIDDPKFTAAGAGDNGKRTRKTSVSKVKRVILCSGKVFYELAAKRDELGRDDVAIVRVEQVYPLHTELVKKTVGRYPTSAELVWVQEEPRNIGAFLFLQDKLREKAGIEIARYIGRDASSSSATGSKRMHKEEQEWLIAQAFADEPEKSSSVAVRAKAKAGAK